MIRNSPGINTFNNCLNNCLVYAKRHISQTFSIQGTLLLTVIYRGLTCDFTIDRKHRLLINACCNRLTRMYNGTYSLN